MKLLQNIKKHMLKSIHIFRRDVRKIWHTKVVLLVLVGISVLPSLYAWFNIAAYVNPYDYTSNLQIAVVNNDVSVNDKTFGEVDGGKEIIDRLQDNDDFGWNFVDEQEAIQGVQSGEYYAAIVIPKNFSSDMISIENGTLKQPQLDYYINEKKNAIAPVIAGVGVQTIQSQVNQDFVNVVTEAVSDFVKNKFNDIKNDLNSNYDSLITNLDSASNNIQDYQNAVDNFKTFTATSNNSIDSIKANLNQIATLADSAKKSLEQSDQVLQTSRGAISDFSSSFSQNMDQLSDILSDLSSTSSSDLGDINGKVQSVNSSVNSTISTLQDTIDLNNQMIDQLKQINNLVDGQPASGLIKKLQNENDKYASILSTLKAGSNAIADATATATSTNNKIQAIIKNGQSNLNAIRSDYNQNVQESLSTSLDEISRAFGLLIGLLDPVDKQVQQLEDVLDGLDSTIGDVNNMLATTKSTMTTVQEQIDTAITDLGTLKSYVEYNNLLDTTNLDSNELADFISSPVQLQTTMLYSMKDYGTALAPFFTNLAIWIGGIMMLAIFKLEVYKDEEIKSYRPTEGYFGRWLLFIIIGQAQSLIVCLGDLFLMHIQCVHPLLFILAGAVASFVYVNLVYALAVTFRHVGKALCVILLIFQIPGSSGTYPIEMASHMFRFLYPFLPFTYSIKAMREAEAGLYGNNFVLDLTYLLLFVILALIIGLVLRPIFLNLNVLFDKKLGDTDLMITEETGVFNERIRLMVAIRILVGHDAFRRDIQTRLDALEQNYQKRIHQFFRIILISTTLFLMVMLFISGSKMLVLLLWIASLIALMLFLILVEYSRERYQRQRRLAELSDQEILELLSKEKDEGEVDN